MDINVQGEINWTKDRIREYEEYLPRLWCNEEVYNWMKANDDEAKRIFPKLDEAILKRGIQFYYELSPMDNPTVRQRGFFSTFYLMRLLTV